MEQRAKSKGQGTGEPGAVEREERAKGKVSKRPHWRFEDLEIWQMASDLAVKFHKVAEDLDQRRLYRYAEQLRAAGLSLSNNIAEGSGSTHKQEFIQFLNIARRSLFENASMLLVFEKMALVEASKIDDLLADCDTLSRKITNFSRAL
jgi:four helix bundle protein